MRNCASTDQIFLISMIQRIIADYPRLLASSTHTVPIHTHIHTQAHPLTHWSMQAEQFKTHLIHTQAHSHTLSLTCLRGESIENASMNAHWFSKQNIQPEIHSNRLSQRSNIHTQNAHSTCTYRVNTLQTGSGIGLTRLPRVCVCVCVRVFVCMCQQHGQCLNKVCVLQHPIT